MDASEQEQTGQESRDLRGDTFRERLVSRWRTVKRQRDVIRATQLLWGTAVLQALLITLLFHSRDHGLVLHYTTRFGIDRVGPWWQLLALPLGLVISGGLNLGLAASVSPRWPVVGGLVVAVNVILALAASATVTLLVLANQSPV